MGTQEQESPAKTPAWTVERVDNLIRDLIAKYPEHAEDTAEVCTLIEVPQDPQVAAGA